jgi:3-oxoadipate CoA-transferase alpha subunit
LSALEESGVTDLTIVANNAGSGRRGISSLLAAGRVRKIVCSYPRSSGSTEFEALYARGAIELDVVPQGTLSERLRAAAAGLGGFYTPTAAGTLLAEGKEQREIDGRWFVLERPLRPDVSLIHAERSDRLGNLTYHSAARNFAPVMAAAAALTIVETDAIVPVGALDPEVVVTPGIFVDRVVRVAR